MAGGKEEKKPIGTSAERLFIRTAAGRILPSNTREAQMSDVISQFHVSLRLGKLKGSFSRSMKFFQPAERNLRSSKLFYGRRTFLTTS